MTRRRALRLWRLIALGALAALVAFPANAAPADDSAWLYDPLQVTEIDFDVSPAALEQLAAAPAEYVEAQITLRHGGTVYGPYRVGLKEKGHASFRHLDEKAAFKVKFGFVVSGQKFMGLKSLTLNNMVQDPSMIAEATSSLLARAAGVPTARVGYAYVRLNGSEYGLYSDVETIDSVLVKRWFPTMQHVYEGNYGNDVVPGREAEFEIAEGSTTDLSDLEALASADAAGADGWWERMQPVADLTEMTKAWAVEHYLGHWDSYSVWSGDGQPNNYDLHSDASGRFSTLITGTDQTWVERPSFGVYGNGLMMRHCALDANCRDLYVGAVRALGELPEAQALAAEARAIRAVIDPWRIRDPRREWTVVQGEASADAKIASMEARPAELAGWLASPSFVPDVYHPPGVADAGGSGGDDRPPDLQITGTVSPDSAPLGASHVWRLQVANTGGGLAPEVVLDVTLSPNIAYGFSQVARGSGCVPTGTGLRCELDLLKASGTELATNDAVISTTVTGGGEISLTATASFAGMEPTPADNTLVLKANVPAPVPAVVSVPLTPPKASTPMRPVLGKASAVPARPVAGRRFTLSMPVTRSDTGAALLTGRMECAPRLAGKLIAHTDTYARGNVRLSLVVPKTAKGKLLKVAITVTAGSRSAAHTYSFGVR